MDRRTHKTAKHAHAKQRAHEHFGINLTKDKINSIIKQIESGKAEPIDDCPASGRVTYLVTLDGQSMRVLYQHEGRTIITVMPQYYNEEW